MSSSDNNNMFSTPSPTAGGGRGYSASGIRSDLADFKSSSCPVLPGPATALPRAAPVLILIVTTTAPPSRWRRWMLRRHRPIHPSRTDQLPLLRRTLTTVRPVELRTAAALVVQAAAPATRPAAPAAAAATLSRDQPSSRTKPTSPKRTAASAS